MPDLLIEHYEHGVRIVERYVDQGDGTHARKSSGSGTSTAMTYTAVRPTYADGATTIPLQADASGNQYVREAYAAPGDDPVNERRYVQRKPVPLDSVYQVLHNNASAVARGVVVDLRGNDATVFVLTSGFSGTFVFEIHHGDDPAATTGWSTIALEKLDDTASTKQSGRTDTTNTSNVAYRLPAGLCASFLSVNVTARTAGTITVASRTYPR